MGSKGKYRAIGRVTSWKWDDGKADHYLQE
jgi:hypothetical protein